MEVKTKEEMIKLKKGRGEGKTTALILKAHQDHAYIVCIDREEVRRVANQAKDMGLKIPFPLTYDEIQGRHMGPGVKAILADDIDMYIEQQIDRFMYDLTSNLTNNRPGCFKGLSHTGDKYGLIEKWFRVKEEKREEIESIQRG